MSIKPLPNDIDNAVKTLKGGQGSGNWGHQGLAGVWGGSSPTKKIGGYYDEDGRGSAAGYMLDYIEEVAGSSVVADTGVRAKIKDDIVVTLSRDTGLDYQTVNGLVGSWAETSNKSPNAYRMQKAVSEELGIPLSPWQRERFRFYEAMDKEYNDIVEEFSKRCLEKFEKQDFYHPDLAEMVREFNAEKSKYIEDKYGVRINIVANVFGDSLAFSVTNRDAYNEGDDGWGEINLEGSFGIGIEQNIPFPVESGQHLQGLKWFLGMSDKKPDSAGYFDVNLPDKRRRDEERDSEIRLFVNAVYKNTQSTLRKVFGNNVTHLKLFRGIEKIDKDTHKKYQTNACESWSLHPSVAKVGFSGGRALETIVPINKIFSSCLSGMGCLHEWEFIILGGDYDFWTV